MEEKNGELWGLSPLQDEHTPSFSVNPEKRNFYDFSSGQGGNLLSFIQAYHKCSFPKAVHLLKEFANIKDDTPYLTTRLEATSIAKKFRPYKKTLRESKSEILPDDYMERYERNEQKLAVWEEEGITKESMERFSVRYDPFSNRIVYPVRNMQGDIINVCGRTLDPDYKEKKLRKYTYFKPLGTLDTLYGFSDNRQYIMENHEIILFEGAKSVMLADGWGIRNTAAILTSHLNPNQFRRLIQLGVDVTFALDAEVDIRKDPNIQSLLSYVNVHFLRNKSELLEPKDAPVDKGFEVFQILYNERRRLR